MNQAWRIELMGGLRVQMSAQVVSRFRTRSAARLLARLALSPSPTRRDVLVEWLWPDAEFETGRNRLSVALSALRRQLHFCDAPPLFDATHEWVALNWSVVSTDVAAFEDALRLAEHAVEGKEASALEHALSLFSGPLLPGEDEAWFAPHARRLADALARGLSRLAELSPATALPLLRRARTFDPTREDTLRALLRALAQQEQLDEARREWAEFKTVLRHAGGRAPQSETRRLADTLFHSVAVPETRASIKGLPLSPSRFFGREEELSHLHSWLSSANASARLITIWGGAGCGKTRLALEAARALSSEESSETFFVALAGVIRASQLWENLVSVLKIPHGANGGACDAVLRALRGRRALLVLDCFEHLVEEGAPEVERLLAGAPGVKVLVTSRFALGLEDERLLALAPLPLPRLDEAKSRESATPSASLLDEWARNPTMRLFFDRARVASPGFRLHAGNARDVAALCHALEGVPLAIELAAARCLALSPAQARAHLGECLDFLRQSEGALSDGDARHISLRAALDWSYGLLSPDAQSTLRRLSVFRSGWGLPSATAVCAPQTPDAARRMLEAHELLRRHALLEGEEVGGEMRFRLPDAVRDYALERAHIEDDARSRKSVQRRHAKEFTRQALVFARSGRNRRDNVTFARLERELPNLRAALEWSLSHEPSLALRLAASLWWFWFGTSRLDEGRVALERALAASAHLEVPVEDGLDARAEALSGAGFLAWRQGDASSAITFGRAGLERARLGERGLALIYSLLVLTLAAMVQTDFARARELGDECLSVSRTRGDQHGEAFALHLLGGIAQLKGEAELACVLQEQAGALFQVLGSNEGRAWTLFNWSIAARRLGEWDKAVELCDQGRALFEELGSREGAAYCDLHAGLALQSRAHSENDDALQTRARQLLLRALDEFAELKVMWGLILALEGLAMNSERDAARAARIWSAAQRLREEIHTPIPPADANSFAAFEEKLRAALGERSFRAQWEVGHALTREQIADEARRVEAAP